MSQTNRGHFVVIEGVEGAGKSTALQTAKNVLTPYVPRLIQTREPGGTAVGELLRSLLQKKDLPTPMNSQAELLLFYAARVQLLDEVIYPALSQGQWVLGDRFELSTWAYQGGGRQIDHTFISTLSKLCLKGFQPDLTIFLDLQPEVGLRRIRQRGQLDRIEQEEQSFFHRVYDSYHQHLKTLKQVIMIDASSPLEVVQQAVRDVLVQYLAQHGIAKQPIS